MLLRLLLCSALSIGGLACGARQPGPTTPGRTEVVVDEATVVTAAPRRDEHGLPPLPVPLDSTSPDFRAGRELALRLLHADGPGPPPGGDEQAYARWTAGPFTDWMQKRAAATRAAVQRLGEVADGPPAEHVVGAALVGLVYERLVVQLLTVPPPPHLSGDPLLLRHYRKGLDDASAEWREAATRALFHCAKHAAMQTDAAYGLWLRLCHDHLADLDTVRKQAKARAETLQRELAEARPLPAPRSAGIPSPSPLPSRGRVKPRPRRHAARPRPRPSRPPHRATPATGSTACDSPNAACASRSPPSPRPAWTCARSTRSRPAPPWPPATRAT
jgi:hypothetical protein